MSGPAFNVIYQCFTVPIPLAHASPFFQV